MFCFSFFFLLSLWRVPKVQSFVLNCLAYQLSVSSQKLTDVNHPDHAENLRAVSFKFITFQISIKHGMFGHDTCGLSPIQVVTGLPRRKHISCAQAGWEQAPGPGSWERDGLEAAALRFFRPSFAKNRSLPGGEELTYKDPTGHDHLFISTNCHQSCCFLSVCSEKASQQTSRCQDRNSVRPLATSAALPGSTTVWCSKGGGVPPRQLAWEVLTANDEGYHLSSQHVTG